jgi:hypothetical protein
MSKDILVNSSISKCSVASLEGPFPLTYLEQVQPRISPLFSPHLTDATLQHDTALHS